MSSFADLFNYYRLKSGFQTLNQFGMALANEGYVYEDSIFSKWKNGEREPHNRNLVISLVNLFIKYKAIVCAVEANGLLNSLQMSSLTPSDGVNFTVGYMDLYSRSFSLETPHFFLQGIDITKSNTRVIIIDNDSVKNDYNHWFHQIVYALAEYYAGVSSGVKTTDDVVKMQLLENFEIPQNGVTFVALTLDLMTGREYISGSFRLLPIINESNCFDFMQYFGIAGEWPHLKDFYSIDRVGEIDRFFIPQWAWSGRDIIIGLLMDVLRANHKLADIKYCYSIMSPNIRDLYLRNNQAVSIVSDTYLLGSIPDAEKDNYTAYLDYSIFRSYWEKYSFISKVMIRE